MRLRDERQGIGSVIATIITVVALILVSAFLWMVFTQIPEEERKKICGDVLGEVDWFELIIDLVNPLNSALDPLSSEPDSLQTPVTQPITYLGIALGIVTLFSRYGGFVLSVAIYNACVLVHHGDDVVYEDEPYERVQNDERFVALLVGLKVQKEDASVIFPSFEVELGFSLDGDVYSLDYVALDEGEKLASLDTAKFPCEIAVRDRTFYDFDGVCEG